MGVKTKDVLKALAVSSLVLSSIAFPGLPKALNTLNKSFKKFNQKNLGRIIKRLEKQEMLSIREHGNQIIIEVTEKGKRRLLEYDFENIEIKAKKRDVKWRLIMFDVPNEKKSSRDAFRRKLLQMGCIMLQESIFVCAFPCKKEVDFLCHFLEISDYVTLVSLDKIERGEQLIFKKLSLGYN